MWLQTTQWVVRSPKKYITVSYNLFVHENLFDSSVRGDEWEVTCDADSEFEGISEQLSVVSIKEKRTKSDSDLIARYPKRSNRRDNVTEAGIFKFKNQLQKNEIDFNKFFDIDQKIDF